MTSKNLEKVIQRAISDAAFRRQLQSSPEAALRGFKLTSEEITALRSGDAGRLQSLGIDQRMSKVFVFGEAGMAASRLVAGNDLNARGPLLADDTARSSGAVIPSDPGASHAVFDEGLVGSASSNAIIGDPIRATTGVAPVEGSPEESAAGINASIAATRSAVRDVEPAAELGATTTYSGDDLAGPGYQAAAIGTRVSDDVADPGPGNLGPTGEVTIGTRVSDDVADPGPGFGVAASDATNVGTRAIREGMSDGSAVTGYGEAYPAHGGLAGPSEAGGRLVRDIEPTDLGSGAVVSESSEPTIGTRAMREGDTAGSAQVEYTPVEAMHPDTYEAAGSPSFQASVASTESAGSARAVRDVAPADIGASAAEPTMGTRAAREGDTGASETATPVYTSAEEMSPDSAENYAPSFNTLASTESTRAVRDSEPSDAFLSTAEATEYAGGAATAMTADGNVLDAGAQTDAEEIVRIEDDSVETVDGNRLDT